MVELDARGLSCPEPLLMATDAMKHNPGDAIHILVSTTNARDNIENAAKKQGRTISIKQVGYDFDLTIE